MTTERILCAAIWIDDGEAHPNQSVPTGLVYGGHRHRAIFPLIPEYTGRRDEPGWQTQGFLTSEGRFVNREAALRIAVAAGQCHPTVRGELSSADLY